MMMHMTANKRVMGDFRVGDGLRVVGWCATAVMAAAVAGMIAGMAW